MTRSGNECFNFTKKIMKQIARTIQNWTSSYYSFFCVCEIFHYKMEIYLKVKKFQNEDMKSSHYPKYERKNLKKSALICPFASFSKKALNSFISIQVVFFKKIRSYFGQCDDFIFYSEISWPLMKFIFGIILLWPSVIIIVKKREGQRKILTDTIFVLITDKIKYFTCIATSGHYCGQCIVLFFKPTTCPGDSMSIVSSS